MNNQQIPSYSGVTINIANPTVNATPQRCGFQDHDIEDMPVGITRMTEPRTISMPVYQNEQPNSYSVEMIPQAYPPQYYLNNYNINEGVGNRNCSEPDIKSNTDSNNLTGADEGANQVGNEMIGANPEPNLKLNESTIPNSQPNANAIADENQQIKIPNEQANAGNFATDNQSEITVTSDKTGEDTNIRLTSHSINPPKKGDMSTSNQIIDELDTLDAEQKELEKNGKQTKVVALTNEYIMSLENYLNNPNTEIRLMASKEILTRLDEDKDRYDDAALNALLNKMLQDPQKLIRIAALSAFSSGLASGNDYTVKLLNDIQQNPNSDKDDVVDAANILLNMSASTETKYVPQKPPVQPNN
jgi:hypothetical protein